VTVPVGRISGRLTDAHGAPLAGVVVHSEPERHEGGSHGWARARSGADGRYELLVPAGQHAVSAGGPHRWGYGEEGQKHAEARVGGLAVAENGHVRGVDLVLVPGAVLAGVVRAGGASAGRAEIFVEGGASLGMSDENGRFEIAGIAPGTQRVRARARGAAMREAVQIELQAGETRRIELELSPATLVRLTVLQGGTPVGSELRVLDENGRPQVVETSSENGKAACGPLTPGRYSVRAQRDGKTVAREFEVTAGEKELALELVFE